MDKKEIKLSASLEDYLETIAELARQSGGLAGNHCRTCPSYGHAHTSDIAAHLHVKMPSVTNALGILSEAGYITYQANQPVLLTPLGKSTASRILRRHHAFEKFFCNFLGVDSQRAEATACKIEHIVDEDIVERFIFLEKALKKRTSAQYFQKWLKEAYNLKLDQSLPCFPLDELAEGDVATVLKLGNNIFNPTSLINQGLKEGSNFTVMEINKVTGVVCELDNKQIFVSSKDAENIWVTLKNQ